MGPDTMLGDVMGLASIRRFLIGVPLILLGVGLAAPAFGQTDLSGTWVNLNHKDGLERGSGPYAVDYTGLPLNEDGRANALGRTESIYGMTEHQCSGWPPH